MRLAVISDVHGNLVALEAVLADIARQSPDTIVNLGDCATGPLWPREATDLQRALAIPTVRGNHDRWLSESGPHDDSPSVRYTRAELTAEQRVWLHGLPATLLIGDILAVHGTPESDSTYLLEENVGGRLALAPADVLRQRLAGTAASLVLCGHSHHQHAAEDGPDTLVLNPGSVGGPRYADNGDLSVAEAGSPHARYAIATRAGTRWRLDLTVVAYDWSPVVDRARANGRADWVRGFLRSGSSNSSAT